MAADLEDAVVRLRAAGADVLLGTGVDAKDSPMVRRTRGRVAVLNSHIWSIARRHDAYVLDLWGMRSVRDWRMWAEDRIHLTTEGHARVAQAALVALGLAPDDDRLGRPAHTPARRSRASSRCGPTPPGCEGPRLPVGDAAAARPVVRRPPRPEAAGPAATGLTGAPVRVRGRPVSARPQVEPPVGFEPTTPCLQDRCSGRLS